MEGDVEDVLLGVLGEVGSHEVTDGVLESLLEAVEVLDDLVGQVDLSLELDQVAEVDVHGDSLVALHLLGLDTVGILHFVGRGVLALEVVEELEEEVADLLVSFVLLL